VSPAISDSIAARLERAAGAAYVRTDARAEYEVDGSVPAVVVQPENAEQAAEVVRIALQEKLVVVACGARSSLGIGTPPARYDIALDMTRLTGVAHYDAGDLTISVNAGTKLAELAVILEKENQFLPLAIPFFERATVSGAIAAGLDSPLRHFYGTARDFLIGAEFVDGSGAQAKSGGRVVKNVTGYDFHKLMNGGLGTLGAITRLNFRTFPLQPSRRGFLASFADESGALGFLKTIAASPLTPALLEVLSPEFAKLFLQEKSPVASLRLNTDAWTVCVGFEGTSEVCERYARELARLARGASAQNATTVNDSQFLAMLEILRETPGAMRNAAKHAVVLRFAALPSQIADLLRAIRSFANSSWMPAPVLVRSGSILYVALLPRDGDESALQPIAYFWRSIGSLRGKLEFNASILFCPSEWKRELDVWAHANQNQDLQQRVKKAFDPSGVFARGRFVGGL
jgi:glycolate oxidase FAD binding subunit